MTKAGSCRPTDVTKLLQKQRRDSQCNGICRILSTGKTSVHLSRNPQDRKFGSITPEIFFRFNSCIAIAVENLTRHRRRKKCDTSTYQLNNFGVSRKHFKTLTPGSTDPKVVRIRKIGSNLLWQHCRIGEKIHGS